MQIKQIVPSASDCNFYSTYKVLEASHIIRAENRGRVQFKWSSRKEQRLWSGEHFGRQKRYAIHVEGRGYVSYRLVLT
jgi:hypothetical protein